MLRNKERVEVNADTNVLGKTNKKFPSPSQGRKRKKERKWKMKDKVPRTCQKKTRERQREGKS